MADTPSPVDFVRIQFSAKDLKGRKLRFKHKDIRDAIKESGMTFSALMTDIFNGWPHLIRYGLRHQDLAVSLDRASEFMDQWVGEPDPETGEKRTMDKLGVKILDAINLSGFVEIKAENPIADEPADEGAEGNV